MGDENLCSCEVFCSPLIHSSPARVTVALCLPRHLPDTVLHAPSKHRPLSCFWSIKEPVWRCTQQVNSAMAELSPRSCLPLSAYHQRVSHQVGTPGVCLHDGGYSSSTISQHLTCSLMVNWTLATESCTWTLNFRSTISSLPVIHYLKISFFLISLFLLFLPEYCLFFFYIYTGCRSTERNYWQS